MAIILIYLLIGWLLHFIHLNDLFAYLLHFSMVQYYAVWFALGSLMAIKSIFEGDE